MELPSNCKRIKPELIVSILLVVFGIAYNWLTEQMEKHGYHHGYLSFIVSLGVAGTLLIAAIREKTASLRFFCYFIASGIPMILGSIKRYVSHTEEDKRELAHMAEMSK